MGEVLADALAFAVRIQPRRVHTRSTRHVLQLAVHPVRRGGDRLLRFVVLRDALTHPPDPLALRRVVGPAEHLIEPVDHRLRAQVLPADLVLGHFAPVGLDHRRRGDLQLGVRGVQVECGHRGAPVVDVAVRPCGGDGFDAVEDDVLPGIRSRRQPGLVEGRGHRRLVGIARRMHDPQPPHLRLSPSSMTNEPFWPASCHATHGAE